MLDYGETVLTASDAFLEIGVANFNASGIR